jgi:hypothetical protein
MKDITITSAQLRKEAIIYTVCFISAFGLNVYSIAKFKTDWSELLGQLHVVLGIAVIIYLVIGLFRLIYVGFSHFIQNNIQNK